MKNSKIFKKAIINRRSVRGYQKKKVPKTIIKDIFKLAQQAPSNCNIQPWYAYVASGNSKKRIMQNMINKEFNKIPPNPDYYYPPNFNFNLNYLKRQVECAKKLYDKMGVRREDKKARKEAFLRNYKMYDAPHVCFIGMYEKFGSSIALDVGIYVQTLMLAMNAFGVSCCAQATLRNYPDVVRNEFKISSSIKILLGISFGYEDKFVKANKTVTNRANIKENIVFKF